MMLIQLSYAFMLAELKLTNLDKSNCTVCVCMYARKRNNKTTPARHICTNKYLN